MKNHKALKITGILLIAYIIFDFCIQYAGDKRIEAEKKRDKLKDKALNLIRNDKCSEY